jgi:hypothetical protein
MKKSNGRSRLSPDFPNHNPPLGRPHPAASHGTQSIDDENMTMLDELETRCPRLGGEVTFAYCQQEAGDLPCQRIIACWQSIFPVEVCLRARLTPEQWERFCHHKPKEKLVTLMELIEAAKARKRDEV